jgi:hypothetical protein
MNNTNEKEYIIDKVKEYIIDKVNENIIDSKNLINENYKKRGVYAFHKISKTYLNNAKYNRFLIGSNFLVDDMAKKCFDNMMENCDYNYDFQSEGLDFSRRNHKLLELLKIYDKNIIDYKIESSDYRSYHLRIRNNFKNEYYLKFFEHNMSTDYNSRYKTYNYLLNIYHNTENLDYSNQHNNPDFSDIQMINIMLDNYIKNNKYDNFTDSMPGFIDKQHSWWKYKCNFLRFLRIIRIIPIFSNNQELYDRIDIMQNEIESLKSKIIIFDENKNKNITQQENNDVMDNFDVITDTSISAISTIANKHKKVCYSKLSPIMKQNKKVFLKLLEKNLIFVFDELDENLKLDLEIVKECIDKKIICDYRNLPLEIKSNREIAMICIEAQILFDYEDLTDNLKTDEEIVLKLLDN